MFLTDYLDYIHFEMLQTLLNQNIAPLSAHVAAPQAQIVQAPTMHFFFDAKDPKLGWLAWDFPSPFIGTGAGNKYLSVFHYCAEKMAFFSSNDELRKQVLAVKFQTVDANGQFDQAAVDRATGEISSLLAGAANTLNWGIISTEMGFLLMRSLAFKFCQNKALFDLLLSTGGDFLVEASTSSLTGIGFTEAQVRANQAPLDRWGQNLHGTILMKLRDELRVIGWDNRPQNFYIYPVPNQGALSFPRPDPNQAQLMDIFGGQQSYQTPVVFAQTPVVQIEIPPMPVEIVFAPVPVVEVPAVVVAEPVIMEEPKAILEPLAFTTLTDFTLDTPVPVVAEEVPVNIVVEDVAVVPTVEVAPVAVTEETIA